MALRQLNLKVDEEVYQAAKAAAEREGRLLRIWVSRAMATAAGLKTADQEREASTPEASRELVYEPLEGSGK